MKKQEFRRDISACNDNFPTAVSSGVCEVGAQSKQKE